MDESMFSNAIEHLRNAGCNVTYSSPSVQEVYGLLESAVHELAHAIVARIPLVPDSVLRSQEQKKEYYFSSRIAHRLARMTEFYADRNEEITLAVGVWVFKTLRIPIKVKDLVWDANWFSAERDHFKYVKADLLRPSTKKHAEKIIRYLKRVDKLPVQRKPRFP